MTKKPISQDVVERARHQYAAALKSARSYIGPLVEEPSPTQKLIAGNPTASELLARGYPQYIAESVARDQEEPV